MADEEHYLIGVETDQYLRASLRMFVASGLSYAEIALHPDTEPSAQRWRMHHLIADEVRGSMIWAYFVFNGKAVPAPGRPALLALDRVFLRQTP